MSHGPIVEEHRASMNELAALIDGWFNGEKSGTDRTIGFALLVFPFGESNDQSRINYISNGPREDMLAAMKEFIARAEGRYQERDEAQHA